ncbi:MAG: polysaccharide deacetylase family protein [Firmicutes bacterium]|nr:polysaccharide deacetylase family protein [Bacillota bacterium]
MTWDNRFKKAITFSFDDGTVQDRILVRILNTYGLKATFNINSGLCGLKDEKGNKIRLSMEEMVSLYEGHEIAIHSKNHPSLPSLNQADMDIEIKEDKAFIQAHVSYPVIGMAYPFGDFNDSVVSVLKDHKIIYARTILSNYQFDLQKDMLRFKPTCHIFDTRLPDLIQSFLSMDSKEPKILYIWGHSFECDSSSKWEQFESLCKDLSSHEDIFYGTNQEVLIP